MGIFAASTGTLHRIAARVRHLASTRSPESLAIGLEQAVEQADRPVRVSSRAPLNRRAIRENRTALLELARELRARRDAPRDGIGPVHTLVADGTSPLYGRAPVGSLRASVDQAWRALTGGGR